jgi:acyl-CoA synthetase (AMP-forming)/AMP-acid ligase II
MSADPSADQISAVRFSCVPHLLEHHASQIPDAPAILAPGRAALPYGQLYRHITTMGSTLRHMGIGRRDRVAVALPNGPELVVAILSVEACAVCAPLNPVYEAEELDRYFADLQPRALIAQAGIDSLARRAALFRGVRIIELSASLDAEAGLFMLTGGQSALSSDEPVRQSDVALLLPTSGTTSRPKIVPLTHANICSSAYASVAALALTESDRCLNVLPLFHGHGLNATVLATLAAGASLVCTPGLDVNSFFAWLTALEPTWYSAVPTMHQAILAHVRHNRGEMAVWPLRFIRSASSPLPPAVLAELEQTFDTCVIEFYAMTETASSPVTCNPMPPRQRKVGSVGVRADLDVAIMDKTGAMLPGGRTGEIVVRGASVTSGYLNDPDANQVAFMGEWFKTGDLGFFDSDGYLFLAGRSKEMINRGGEKIAPREVDEALLEHPTVAEAVTFAIPHPTLGEDVAAAIVLRPDAVATPQDIRQFVAGRIADFKVPRHVLIVSELPKGPTGKVQRIGLAAKLGIEDSGAIRQSFVPPRTPLEQRLAEYWAEILRLERVGIHDDFFALGGDSLLAVQALAHIHEIMQFEVNVSRFFEAPTVADVAHHIETSVQAGGSGHFFPAIARASRENGMPASIAQERLWKLQRMLPGIPLFNVLYALRLNAPFDATVLEQCINEIVRRHEILRTNFADIAGRCVQVIAPQVTIPLSRDDLCMLPDPEKETAGHQLVQQEVLYSFDLVQGPLLRARLMRVNERESMLIFTLHQIIGDGWSLGVLVNELVALYDAFSAQEESPLASLPLQFADFAHWQHQWRSQPHVLSQLEYWREQLRDPLPVMELTRTRPRQTIDSLRTARRPLAMPASLLEAAKSFGRREGGTLFMVLVAALKTLLHCYASQDDVRVATLVANRNRPGTAGLIGPLANTLILRTDLGGDPSPHEVMRRVRATTLAALTHQDLRFEELVETLERERAIRPAVLSQVMLMLHNASLRPNVNDGQRLALEETDLSTLVPLMTATNFDITLVLYESADGLTGSCIYNPHCFDTETIDCLIRDFHEVLEQTTTQPQRPISAIRVSLAENRRHGEPLWGSPDDRVDNATPGR